MKIADAIKQQVDILCQPNQVTDVIAILTKYGVPRSAHITESRGTFISLSYNAYSGASSYCHIMRHMPIFPLITAGEFIAHNPISEGTNQHPRDHAGRYDN